ncbi:16S rRNA (adenine(1518)-N(6)/adenine(1519)-N(6))-dimethyltransferase RsmA [Paenalcaligenes niemegkensis]|uniref:16S rRNA (adenine(1518)-N(6)/adenine(1519)-N(6))- dimethyltransferase RsmA n=1 Tax=Paenalcaligenes niemegkensis TaxID=2895469 RepID=UPI001EE870E7|nr:16S rRNA (adenine(1518)-N(6)/adenine(1519)-N(6))-dimethyltransferase RsmA [Paenalcaligenes niemegkensis]MCQ9615857.1 16S rRNA (adenine(1518)-N(6)/adenine(1519)-N(6))-dimethyltransferase RsmA [Paenalcaligenes niemegkensis]
MAQHQARKRFGQNFLHDESVIEEIIRGIDPRPDDNLVEIGPGLAALTRPLSKCLNRLTVIELDRDLVTRLQNSFSTKTLNVIEADALKVDFSTLGPNLRVVGNLPYNISSPMLFHLMQFADGILDQHFMLQREVIERMVAKPGDSDYSRLSVMLQARYRMFKLFDVAPEAFDPAPKVVSAIVRMRPLPADRPQAKNTRAFEKVVAQAFTQRRKMLRGSLSQWTKALNWDALAIDPTSRPGDLSVEQFIALADAIYESGVMGDIS